MNKSNDYIVLVENDEATKFVYKYDIKADFTNDDKVGYDRQENLDFQKYRSTDMTDLDVNTPLMNGWELLEQYQEPNEELLSQMMVVMLTTPLNSDGRVDSEFTDSIDQFMRKLLTMEMIHELDLKFSALAS